MPSDNEQIRECSTDEDIPLGVQVLMLRADELKVARLELSVDELNAHTAGLELNFEEVPATASSAECSGNVDFNFVDSGISDASSFAAVDVCEEAHARVVAADAEGEAIRE